MQFIPFSGCADDTCSSVSGPRISPQVLVELGDEVGRLVVIRPDDRVDNLG
jgi:hypothetical protein